MIQRFENTPPYGRKSILQIMKPWLRNVELVEESTKVLLPQAHVLKNNILSVVAEKTSNPVLSDSGWGSLEGTYLVLHNLLYLTAKVRYVFIYCCNLEPPYKGHVGTIRGCSLF